MPGSQQLLVPLPVQIPAQVRANDSRESATFTRNPTLEILEQTNIRSRMFH